MCGVAQVAFLNTPNKPERAIADRVTQILMGELLIATLPRGKDATGIALAHEDKSYAYLKGGWESPKMVNLVKDKTTYPDNWESLLQRWSGFKYPVVNAIGHVRKETKGLSSNNDNCHPIHRGNILGVHNGQAENDTDILKDLEGIVAKRKGECDSEAIFALMESIGNESDWTPDMVKEVCGRLSGAFTVLAFNRLFPHKFILFRNAERPASIGIDFNLGLMVVGSEGKNIDDAVSSYNRIAGLYYHKELPTLNMTTGIFGANKGLIVDLNQPLGSDKYVYEFLKGKEFDVSFLEKKTKSYSSGTTQNAYSPTNHVSGNTSKPTVNNPLLPSSTPTDVVAVTPCSVDELGESLGLEEGEYLADITHVVGEALSGAVDSTLFSGSMVDHEDDPNEALDEEDDEDELIEAAAESAYKEEPDVETLGAIAEEIEDAFEAKGISAVSATSSMNAEEISELCNSIFEAGYKLGFKSVYTKTKDEVEKLRVEAEESKTKIEKKEALTKRAYDLSRSRERQLEALKKVLVDTVQMFSEESKKTASPKVTIEYLATRCGVDKDLLLGAFKKELEEDSIPQHKESSTNSVVH